MDSLKCQIASGKVCSERMQQRLANALMDFEATIDDFNYYATHAQQVVHVAFRSKPVA